MKKKTRKKAAKKIVKKAVQKITIQRKVPKIMAKIKSSKNITRKISKIARSGASYVKRSAKRIKGTKHDMKSIAIASSLGVAGAIIAAFIANKLPIKDARIKAGLPLVAGIAASMTKFGSQKMLQPVIAGAIIGGGVSLVRQFVPGLATMAGEDDFDYPDAYMGGIEDFSGVTEIGYNNIGATDSFGADLDDQDDFDASNMGDESEVWATTADA
jgi:hypothetical protein